MNKNYSLLSLKEVKIYKSKCLKELLNKTFAVNNALNYDVHYENIVYL